MRESDIEKYLVKRVKELGGEVRKVKWVGREGAPDRLVMLPPREEQLRQADFAREEASLAFDNVPLADFLRSIAAMLRSTTPSVYVELKAPGKAATFPADAHERKQAREHARLRAMGQRVVVVDSFEGVERVLS